ncbi:MAG: SGNH/GDSL hydrolase family protein [Chitinophagaceae bacterium]
MKHPLRILCLGDSYTIGESVPLHQGFPYQLVQQLRKVQITCYAPEIVAKTGWTSGELLAHLEQHTYLPMYDYITLLIGVNNQYRGNSIDIYRKEFEILLQKALHWANQQPKQVFVLSIPDWAQTPFAKPEQRETISKGIDAFNAVNQSLATAYKVHYVNITIGTRNALTDKTILAEDQLHYSGTEHARWANAVATIIAHQEK